MVVTLLLTFLKMRKVRLGELAELRVKLRLSLLRFSLPSWLHISATWNPNPPYCHSACSNDGVPGIQWALTFTRCGPNTCTSHSIRKSEEGSRLMILILGVTRILEMGTRRLCRKNWRPGESPTTGRAGRGGKSGR